MTSADQRQRVSSGQLWYDAIAEVLRVSRYRVTDELPSVVAAATSRLGLRITLYLADLEQQALHPLPGQDWTAPTPLRINASLAGRAFTQTETVNADRRRLWVPVLDGTERLGVMLVEASAEAATDEAALRDGAGTLANLLGHLIAAKFPYGDSLQRVRRTQPMSEASELLAALLPPLTYTCDRAVVSAILEPAYEVGGDGFDYAVGAMHAKLAVYDAMGHGIRAGLTTALALAATRAARRDGHGLYSLARAADERIQEEFGEEARFVTAVLADLNMDSGVVRYLNAGHPAPLLLRGTKVVGHLTGGRRLPLGLDDPAIEVAEEQLQPGDRILVYTDGVTEARDAEGEAFGVQRLIDLLERHAAARMSVPETLRRLSHAVQGHRRARLDDDATMLLVEWVPGGPMVQPPG
ncbi:MAG TPA: PP2C family protein-serine/threonine phosphatase [Micromonosporaceae bacterium]